MRPSCAGCCGHLLSGNMPTTSNMVLGSETGGYGLGGGDLGGQLAACFCFLYELKLQQYS
jgi:hypothetical protein